MPEVLADPARAEWLKELFEFAPEVSFTVLILVVGAYGGYWLYSKGRQDEQAALSVMLDQVERLRRRD